MFRVEEILGFRVWELLGLRFEGTIEWFGIYLGSGSQGLGCWVKFGAWQAGG